MEVGFMHAGGSTTTPGFWRWTVICTVVNCAMIFAYVGVAALAWSVFS